MTFFNTSKQDKMELTKVRDKIFKAFIIILQDVRTLLSNFILFQALLVAFLDDCLHFYAIKVDDTLRCSRSEMEYQGREKFPPNGRNP